MNKIGDCFKLTNSSRCRDNETYLKIIKLKLGHIVYECYSVYHEGSRSKVIISEKEHDVLFNRLDSFVSISSDEYDLHRVR